MLRVSRVKTHTWRSFTQYTVGTPLLSAEHTSSSSLHSPPTETMCTSLTQPKALTASCQSSMGESFTITHLPLAHRVGASPSTSGVQSAMA